MAEYYTIRDIAKEFNCTYEAVRSQTKRYEKELSDHCHTQGRTTYYDGWALEFLDSHRVKRVLVEDTNEVVEQLRAENKSLLEHLASQSEKLYEQSEQLREYDKLRLEADNKIAIAENRADEAEQSAAEYGAEIERLRQELSEAKSDLEAEQSRKLTARERFFGRKKK